MSRLEAMTIESAAQTSSKRKNAPQEDEGEDEGDDSGSDGGSDVVCPLPALLIYSIPIPV